MLEFSDIEIQKKGYDEKLGKNTYLGMIPFLLQMVSNTLPRTRSPQLEATQDIWKT